MSTTSELEPKNEATSGSDNVLKRSFRVLVLEDREEDADLILKAIQTCGFPVEAQVAANGRQALEFLGLEPALRRKVLLTLDLIISDYKMPLMDGAEVLQRLREAHHLDHVPYVMFSSSAEKWEVERCLSGGANAYCKKPNNGVDFCNCVREILQRWLGHDDGNFELSCMVQEVDRTKT